MCGIGKQAGGSRCPCPSPLPLVGSKPYMQGGANHLVGCKPVLRVIVLSASRLRATMVHCVCISHCMGNSIAFMYGSHGVLFVIASIFNNLFYGVGITL